METWSVFKETNTIILFVYLFLLIFVNTGFDIFKSAQNTWIQY